MSKFDEKIAEYERNLVILKSLGVNNRDLFDCMSSAYFHGPSPAVHFWAWDSDADQLRAAAAKRKDWGWRRGATVSVTHWSWVAKVGPFEIILENMEKREPQGEGDLVQFPKEADPVPEAKENEVGA